jgi:glycerophosphoryl diester phosphodiesterase
MQATLPWTLGHAAYGRPLVWGHRGAEHHVAGSGITENTLPSFERARERGADGIELDVRLCASGEVVVFHDDDLARLAGRAARIEDLPLSLLRDIPLHNQAVVPTLDEVLVAMAAPMVINVEIKTVPARSVPRLVTAVLATILRSPAADRVIVSSFDPVILAAVRVGAPHLPSAYLFHAEQGAPMRRGWPAYALRPHALHPQASLVDRARVRAWRRRGFAINVWTVNDPAEVARLAELGVDGIITDDPASARAVLDR